MERSFVVKGDFCYSLGKEELITRENAYLVCINGSVEGIYETIPDRYRGLPLEDHSHKLIIPGLVDMHVHAPQFPFRGLGMDKELMDWLWSYAFPEEGKYMDPDYARDAYREFVRELRKSATTRACIFGSRHVEATEILMDLLEESGLITFVGKVNMDRNAPDYLKETSAQASVDDTRYWLEKVRNRYRRVKPILTPRFVPSCTERLLEGLKEIQADYRIPVQSHLSESPGEISFVKELCPWASFYGEIYQRYGLFGGPGCPTIMAHCVFSSEEEIALLKNNGVWVAHCPDSNMNISSGIAPIRKYLDGGLHLGLGTDIAGGSTLSLFRTMAQTIQLSKMYWRHIDPQYKALNMKEVFYMATLGGGEFWGNTGSFQKDFAFDAIVIQDDRIAGSRDRNLEERLERVIYLADDRNICAKYVAGEKLF